MPLGRTTQKVADTVAAALATPGARCLFFARTWREAHRVWDEHQPEDTVAVRPSSWRFPNGSVVVFRAWDRYRHDFDRGIRWTATVLD